MSTDIQRIQNALEEAYDIPFHVEGGMNYDDPWFLIYPDNSTNEFFELKFTFRQTVRLVIEMKPQKYAAFLVKDMSNATSIQRKIFAEYAKVLADKKAKIEMYINQNVVDPLEPEKWLTEWNSVSCRISRSPVITENENFNPAEITATWGTIVSGMFLSLLNVVPVDNEENNYPEGKKEQIIVNRYERNPFNRELCLAVNGYDCKICGTNFEKVYGELGHNFIHVHHIIPVSKMGGEYVINPVKELIPVCPNCHSMLHRQDPPLMPDELKRILENTRK